MLRTHVVIHHSATADGDTVSWGAIERFHRSWRIGGTIVSEAEGRRAKAAGDPRAEAPWSDIGYHAGVERVGGSYYAMLGRSIRESAAACRQGGLNGCGLHVCCVGNFDLEEPSAEMLSVLVARVVRPWCLQFGITAERVIGHRDGGLMEGLDWHKGQYKSCPGKLFDLQRVRAILR